MREFKEKIGEEAFDKLQTLIKREANILNITDDFEVRKKAIELLLAWLGSIYDVKKTIELYEPELDFDKLFKDRNFKN
jgi:hypothetical protein